MREKDNESTSLCIRADKVDRAERGDSETETERGKGVGEETEAEGLGGQKGEGHEWAGGSLGKE